MHAFSFLLSHYFFTHGLFHLRLHSFCTWPVVVHGVVFDVNGVKLFGYILYFFRVSQSQDISTICRR